MLTQYGSTVLLEIHDPVFLEKLAQFIPEQIDRFIPTWGPGYETFGKTTMFD